MTTMDTARWAAILDAYAADLDALKADVAALRAAAADDLEDPQDPMTVGLGGPCSACGAPVDPATGLCAGGHDDLDRADAATTAGSPR